MALPQLNLTEAAHVGPLREPSVKAMTAPGRAMQATAGAIKNAANALEDVVVKVGRARDDGAMSRYRAMLASTASEMEQVVISNPDPENWQPEWERRLGKLDAEMDKLKLSPNAALQMRNHRHEFEARLVADLGVKAMNATYREAVAQGTNELKTLAEARDLDAFESRAREMRELGYFTESQEQELVHEASRKIAARDMEDLLLYSPKDALELAESKSFFDEMPGATEHDRKRWEFQAKQRIQAKQAEELRALSGAMNDGSIATEADFVEALGRAEYIDDTFHDELRFHFEQSQPLDAETRFSLSDSLNDLHDSYKAGEMSLDDYRLAHDELAQIVFSLGSRDGSGALRERVHALDPAKWNGRNLDLSKEESAEKAVSDLGKIYQAQRAFGGAGSDEEAKELEPAERARLEAESYLLRERTERSVLDWLKQNPDAGPDEVTERFRKTYIEQVAADVIAPAPKSPEARRRSLGEILGEPVSPAAGPPGARNNTPDAPVGGSLREMVKSFEGFHETAYFDHKQHSVGYGTKGKPGETITKEEAERRLDQELALHRRRVEREAERCGLTFEAHELDALTSFDFNTGKIGQLLAGGTRSKAEIASKMLLYRNASGKPLRGLQRRRMAEAKLFRRGW